MGATKRIAELIVQRTAQPSGFNYVCVRFGNVLGSLSGLHLGTDIEIKFSGIRPGEKLFEELSLDHEHMKPTAHEKILCALIGTPGAALLHMVDALLQAAQKRETDEHLRKRIGELVPEYVALGTSHVVKRELTLVA